MDRSPGDRAAANPCQPTLQSYLITHIRGVPQAGEKTGGYFPSAHQAFIVAMFFIRLISPFLSIVMPSAYSSSALRRL
jgi:hypothetical protein